ncbi:MAG: hypothetical protein ACK5S5_04605, partial [Planctomycetota bacterium]
MKVEASASAYLRHWMSLGQTLHRTPLAAASWSSTSCFALSVAACCVCPEFANASVTTEDVNYVGTEVRSRRTTASRSTTRPATSHATANERCAPTLALCGPKQPHLSSDTPIAGPADTSSTPAIPMVVAKAAPSRHGLPTKHAAANSSAPVASHHATG